MRLEVDMVGEDVNIEGVLRWCTAGRCAEGVGDVLGGTELGHSLITQADPETSIRDEIACFSFGVGVKWDGTGDGRIMVVKDELLSDATSENLDCIVADTSTSGLIMYDRAVGGSNLLKEIVEAKQPVTVLGMEVLVDGMVRMVRLESHEDLVDSVEVGGVSVWVIPNEGSCWSSHDCGDNEE